MTCGVKLFTPNYMTGFVGVITIQKWRSALFYIGLYLLLKTIKLLEDQYDDLRRFLAVYLKVCHENQSYILSTSQ